MNMLVILGTRKLNKSGADWRSQQFKKHPYAKQKSSRKAVRKML